MDEPPTPATCVFCGRPVAGNEACPLLGSSHWTCCACEARAELVAVVPRGEPGRVLAWTGTAVSTRP